MIFTVLGSTGRYIIEYPSFGLSDAFLVIITGFYLLIYLKILFIYLTENKTEREREREQAGEVTGKGRGRSRLSAEQRAG